MHKNNIRKIHMPITKLKGEIIILYVSKSQKYLLKREKNKNIYNFIKNIKNKLKKQDIIVNNNKFINNNNIIFTQITNKNNLRESFESHLTENNGQSKRSSLVSFESIVSNTGDFNENS